MAGSAEDAVRNYLLHLDGSAPATEDERVAELRQRLEASDDPVERVQLHAELARASEPRPLRIGLCGPRQNLGRLTTSP